MGITIIKLTNLFSIYAICDYAYASRNTEHTRILPISDYAYASRNAE